MPTATANVLPLKKDTTNYTAVFIIGVLFFVFGFVTWLNGALIPFLKLACELQTDTQAFFVTTAFYMAYFFLAIPLSKILKFTGFKNGMALGLFIMAIGSVIFIPAANARSFPLFLTGLFIQGAGLALLQTASNPYMSLLGPIESAAKRISIMGIFNKGAGMIGLLMLSTVALKNASELEEQIVKATDPVQRGLLLDQLASRVVTPYIIIAVVLVIVALFIRISSLPEVNTDEEDASMPAETRKTSVFQYPHLLLGVLCIFLYVGAEVMAGDAIGMYGRSMGMSLDETKYFTIFTLSAMLVGYIIGIVTIPKVISQQTGLKISAISGIIFTACTFMTHGYTAITFIALLGLSNSLMWPAIFPLAISGLGRFTKIGAALLVMGIAGGALIPLLYGELKKEHLLGNSTAFFVCMLPCYLYILYYSAYGYRAGKKNLAKE
ncbi:MAG: sugar MFS transporter [Chitinophagaceae bacterium]|nr:sugar MFS transporter [Chitinophagaceae bacterium]